MTDNSTFDDYLRSLHPRMTDEPNYPLVLAPEDEARWRVRLEKVGVDYDNLKREFLLSYQIIRPKPHDEGMAFMDQNAIPLNSVRNYFEGTVEGAVRFMEIRQRQQG